MKTLNFPISACRLCRHYQPEGRRGGTCQQLSVPTRANWKACSLALPPFGSSWDKIEEIWQEPELILQEAFSVNYSLGGSKPNLIEEKNLSTSNTVTIDKVVA